MSEHYDFHYQPTGSGAISGQQVLEQTEDAINELGDYVYDNVGGAMDVAQQALETAQTAETNAQTALDTANSFSSAIQSAQQDASTALSTAQTAQTTATNANNTAIQASQDASSAVTTANNASGQVSTLSGTVTALGQRVTTAEGNIGQNTSDITALTTRVGTAEGNITTLQNDVSIAMGNASSAMATAGQVKQQAFVFRYSSTALVASSTNSNTLLDNTDNLKVGDKVIDSSGVLFSITAIDTVNSTFTVGSALIDLALDANVVHTSGNETIGGQKTFTDNPLVGNGNTNITISNRQITANGSASTTGNHAYSYMRFQAKVTYADSSSPIDATVVLNINEDAYADGKKSSFSPNGNNITNLGTSGKRWANVYATNYYYGGSEIEFSQKFVTTDTNQTISGEKTFQQRPIIFNSNATVQADVPNLVFKNPLVERASTTLEGEQTILFTDKNNNNIASIQAKTYTSGTSDIILTSYSETSEQAVRTTGIVIRRSPTTSKFHGYSDNITSLGDTNRRWSKVYAMNYYYGNDNVEFSNKFVTTDTAQTISGNKTFSNDLTVANTDTTANIPNLTLRNYKLDRGTTDTGVQTITFLDKNAKALTTIESRRTSNGSTGTNILTYNTDDSNNTVLGGVSIIKSKTNTNFAPNTDNAVTCGRALAKWSDVQTYKVNSLEPSSLSLPSDRSARVDISSYITNLGNGNDNSYTVPANGYIYLYFTSINGAICFSQTTGGLTNYAQTFVRYQGDGQLYVFFPVRKGDTFIVKIYTSSTAVVQNAYFIPCQGNV